jgi:hypothetical protein
VPNLEDRMAETLEGLAGVLAEREPRFARPRVTIIEAEEKDRKIGLADPGTIAVLVASDDGAGMLNDIERSIARKDFARLEDTYATLKRQYIDAFTAGRPLYDSRRDIPFLMECRYAGKTLRQGMIAAPQLPVAHSLVLYNGAELALDQFRAVEYRRPGAQEPAHMLIVVREPRLTELERDILTQVSVQGDAAGAFNVGESVQAWTDVVVDVAYQAVQEVAQQVVEYVVDKAVEVVAEVIVAAVVGGDEAEDDRAAEEGAEENAEGTETEDAWQQGLRAAAPELQAMDPNVAARALLRMRGNLIGSGKATLP